MRNGLLIVLIAICFAGCRQPKELVYQDVQEITLNNVNLQHGSLSMNVRLYNPNTYSLKVKHSHIDVYMNGNAIGLISIPGGATIARLDTSAIPVMLDFDIKQALPDLIAAAIANNISLKLDGSIKAGRHGVFIRVPVHYEGNVKPF